MQIGRRFFWISAILGLLVACGDPPEIQSDTEDNFARTGGSILGPGGLTGAVTGDDGGAGGAGIAVNGYLWRASLDTVSFFPMSQVDAFGGVIITEWYSLPEAPNERYKLSVFILNRELRADGVRVTMFKQVRNAGGWVDAPVSEGAAAQIENAILTRARQLRIDNQALLD